MEMLCPNFNFHIIDQKYKDNMDISDQAILTISILMLSILCCILISRRSRKNIALLPPGPRGLPIVGYLPFLDTNLHIQFTDLARRYGPIYKLQLGNKLCVVLSSPSLVQDISKDQDVIFANRDSLAVALVATFGGFDIFWSRYGSYWRNMRKMFVQQMMSKNILDGSYDFRKDDVRKVIKHVETKIGFPIDIGEITFHTEFNVIMKMLWGSTTDDVWISKVGLEFKEAFIKIIELFSKPNISDFFPVLGRFDLQGIKKEMEGITLTMGNIFDFSITERLKRRTPNKRDEKRDFIQILLDQEEQKEIDRTQIKAVLLDVLLGAIDTTVTTIEWVMTNVIHNKEVMLKVQKELDEVVGVNNTVEEFHLPRLQYLDAVIKETLRLYPILPLLIPRKPSQTCIIGGYTIPKDASVYVNAWAIHRDPKVWENPLDFKPERFLNEPKKWDFVGKNFEYIPFGAGRRICAGISLAERMVNYMLASLLHSFDWKSTQPKEHDLIEKFGIMMKKSKPLLAIPTRKIHT